jgi:hypothetical protein
LQISAPKQNAEKILNDDEIKLYSNGCRHEFGYSRKTAGRPIEDYRVSQTSFFHHPASVRRGFFFGSPDFM